MHTNEQEFEEKKFLLSLHIPAFYEAVQARIQSLTIISTFAFGVCTAFLGLPSTNATQNKTIAYIAIIILFITFIVSTYLYLTITKNDIKEMREKIETMVQPGPIQTKIPVPNKTDNIPEILFISIVIGIIIFWVSYIPFFSTDLLVRHQNFWSFYHSDACQFHIYK